MSNSEFVSIKASKNQVATNKYSFFTFQNLTGEMSKY